MLSIHSSLVGERMSSGSKAMSEHSSSVYSVAVNDVVYLSGYESMAKDPTGSQERKSLAHSFEEKEEEEEKTTSPSGENFRTFILSHIKLMNNYVPKM